MKECITPADLLRDANLQALLECFGTTLGIASSVIDADGQPLSNIGAQDACHTFQPATPDICQRCNGHSYFHANATELKAPAPEHRCPHGLHGITTPIIINGQPLAHLRTGRFFTAPPDLHRIRAHFLARPVAYAKQLDAVAAIPVIPEERFKSMARLLTLLAQNVATTAEESLRLALATKALGAAQQQIQQNRETKYHQAIETSADGYWMTDAQGKLLEVNEAYVKASGYSRAELLSMHISDLEANETPHDLNAHITRIISQGNDRFESLHKAKDGHFWMVDVAASFAPMAGARLFFFIKDISERKRIELALKESEERYRLISENSHDGVWILDLKGNSLYRSPATLRMRGYTPDEACTLSLEETLVGDSLRLAKAEIEKLIQGDGSYQVNGLQVELSCKDGGSIWGEISASLVVDEQGQRRIVGSTRNITERKALEQKLLLTQFAMDHASVEVIWIDQDARIRYANLKTCETLGYSMEELTQLSIPDIDPLFPAEVWGQHWQGLRKEQTQYFETQHRRKDGSILPVEIVANYVALGGVEYNVAFVRDISKRKDYERQLEHRAHTDYLTGLNNRRHFSELVAAELMRSIRYSKPVSVLLMDVDHFKNINDTHGHKTGDSVLQRLAEVCIETLREVDLIGRWGGEEFAVLLPETPSDKAFEVADRLRIALASNAVALEDGSPLRFTVSIGCASTVSDQDGLDTLLNRADAALYEAKNSRRNRVCLARD